MPFRFLQLLDQILGTLLLLTIGPLCSLIARVLPSRRGDTPRTIACLKLHGGGSLLIALPALLGIRAKFPKAAITLIGTAETQKYAELTGVFDRYVSINSGSFFVLLVTGVRALASVFRHDVVIDLEPHSFLAAVFCPLTLASRRIGFVRAGEPFRAASYTDALPFDLRAPIYVFYEQVAALLDAKTASVATCRAALRSCGKNVEPVLNGHPRPAVYVSAFTSSLAPERMMPVSLWVEQLRKKFGTAPFTLILGGGEQEAGLARDFAALVTAALPLASILETCGTRSLRQAIADIDGADEFWSVDTGPLHIARLLGKRSVSFWGPSDPAFRLCAIPGLEEQVFYRKLPCSPCVHRSTTPPCKGDNQCMKQLFAPDVTAPAWCQ